MTAPTHTIFGLLTSAVAFSLTSSPLSRDYGAMSGAVIGSLLPDVDSPTSAMGRLVPFVSVPLERRWGHRTVTHSLLALAGVAVAAAPLVALSRTAYFALLIGYLSHLISDCATKSGVPLLYPNLTPCVIPANDKYRVHTGSLTGEGPIFLVLVAVTLAFVPISNIGLWRAVHHLMGTQEAAYADYREIETEALLSFKGKWRTSKTPVEGEALLLDAGPSVFLICFEGRTLEFGPNGEILPDRARVKDTHRPIHALTVEVERRAWEAVAALVPEEGFLSGTLTADVRLRVEEDGAPLLEPPEGTFASVKVQGKEVFFRFAPQNQIARLTVLRDVDPEERRSLRHRIEGMELEFLQDSLRRPPVHYLELQQKRLRIEELRRELSRMDHPGDIRLTGSLSIRSSGN
jgi:inner membrane protein